MKRTGHPLAVVNKGNTGQVRSTLGNTDLGGGNLRQLAVRTPRHTNTGKGRHTCLASRLAGQCRRQAGQRTRFLRQVVRPLLQCILDLLGILRENLGQIAVRVQQHIGLHGPGIRNMIRPLLGSLDAVEAGNGRVIAVVFVRQDAVVLDILVGREEHELRVGQATHHPDDTCSQNIEGRRTAKEEQPKHV